MEEVEDLLAHVRQRLDALTYDDHSQYLLGSVQAGASFFGSNSARRTHGPSTPPGPQGSNQPAPRRRSLTTGTTITSRRRKPALRYWARYVGLTSYYVRFVLLLGAGWFFAMMGIFTFLYAVPAAKSDIAITSRAQIILLLAVYFLGGALGCMAFGMCADHFGRRRVLLAAVGFWILVNALTAAAWNYGSFVALRLLSGVGLGGQVCLLLTVALEYTPTRTRGRITVLTLSLAGLGVFGGVAYGHLACPDEGEGGIGWRVAYLVLSGAAVVYEAVLFIVLEESPKFLASMGRTQEALQVLEKIETAHGINRQARITVPTSLYEPPSQHKPSQRSYDNLDDSISGDSEAERDRRYNHSYHYNYSVEDAELRSALASGRRQSRQSQREPPRHRQRSERPCRTPVMSLEPLTPTDALANVSFARGLSRRVVMLFSRSLALRTVLIWVFWFIEFMCVSAGIATTTLMAATFLEARDSSFELGEQLFWASMTLPGFWLAASLMETVGRRIALALFGLCDALVLLLAATLLTADTAWLGFSLSMAALSLAAAGTLGALCAFTGEQFPLLARALGISCAAAWGHLGMFAGVYMVLRRVAQDAAWTWQDERVLLAACSGVSLLLLPFIIGMGMETKGREIDTMPWSTAKELEGLEQLPSPSSNVPNVPMRISESPYAMTPDATGHSVIASTPKRSEPSTGDACELPDSPFATCSANAMVVPPAVYSPASAALAMAAGSPSGYSSSSSSCSSSGFWQTRSVHRLGRKVKRAARAMTGGGPAPNQVREKLRLSVGKSALSRSAGPKVNTSVRRARGGSSGARANTLPHDSDELDNLDLLVAGSQYRRQTAPESPLEEEKQPESRRRQSLLTLLEPMIQDLRRSLSSSLSLSARDLSGSSKASKSSSGKDAGAAAGTVSEAQADLSSSDTGRYTIDLDMFDTFTYISTPVLGEREREREREHEHEREHSVVSSLDSRG